MAQRIENQWIISAQDVVSQFECNHKLRLNLAKTLGLIDRPEVQDENLEMLKKLGAEFEAKTLAELQRQGQVVIIPRPCREIASYQKALAETEAAMAQEAEVIYQATLFSGELLGFVDFLILRKDAAGEIVRSGDGRAIYEPVDCKSARSEKPGAVLQVGFYAHLLELLGYPAPVDIHLWLAGENRWRGDAAKASVVAREILQQVQVQIATETSLPNPQWAAPRPACETCAWANHCESGRQSDRDLSLVQGIQSVTRGRMLAAGIRTIDDLAAAPEDLRVPRVSFDTVSNLRIQAELQARGEREGRVIAELKDAGELAVFPAASEGDVWFDMEGDPYADSGKGHEYMFGLVYRDSGELVFRTFDAIDLSDEREAFDQFMQFITERWKQYPDMHVYHYADYERRALSRLSQKYALWVPELDSMLTEGLLFDMYALVRKSIRFSTQSLSIKYIEAIYGESHEGEVATAAGSVLAFQRVTGLMESGDREEAMRAYEQIRQYNEVDCRSTQKLDSWIRDFARENGVQLAARSTRVESQGRAPSDTQIAAQRLEQLSAEVAHLWAEQELSALKLLQGALLFHEREDKVGWWRHFDLVADDLDSLDRKTGAMTISEVTAEPWTKSPRAKNHKRQLTLSHFSLSAQDALEGESSFALIYETCEQGMSKPSNSIRGYSSAALVSFEEKSIVVEESGREGAAWDALPIAVVQFPRYDTKPLKDALLRMAEAVLATRRLPDSAWAALLKRQPPNLVTDGPNAIENIVATLNSNDNCFVAVQGPPGTGKTFVGSRVIASLANAGWRIGVVAQSHAVVENLLDKVVEHDPTLRVGKEAKGEAQQQKRWSVSSIESWVDQQRGGFVAGGTAWKFAKFGQLGTSFDLLVVDEAGQFSLAMTLASSESAKRILLLGDPQQLAQVSNASHPEGAEVSALEHVAGEGHTLDSSLGYFLAETYRMHPNITKYVSALQYENRLSSHPKVLGRELIGHPPGVFGVRCEHLLNTTSSPEEAQVVASIAQSLLGSRWLGDEEIAAGSGHRELEMSDLIVVAAFNDQVRTIRRVLSERGLGAIRVGTVDKFQGQEAVIVIVSLAASSADELPRGIDFLLSPNRLNVAISRGMWASYIVHSPALRSLTSASVQGLLNLGGLLNLVGESA